VELRLVRISHLIASACSLTYSPTAVELDTSLAYTTSLRVSSHSTGASTECWKPQKCKTETAVGAIWRDLS